MGRKGVPEVRTSDHVGGGLECVAGGSGYWDSRDLTALAPPMGEGTGNVHAGAIDVLVSFGMRQSKTDGVVESCSCPLWINSPNGIPPSVILHRSPWSFVEKPNPALRSVEYKIKRAVFQNESDVDSNLPNSCPSNSTAPERDGRRVLGGHR
jgi:hypothetical protein